MNTKKFVGLIGPLALFIGVFTPVFSYSVFFTEVNINYFDNDPYAGMIMLILAGISLPLVLVGKFKGLWFTGLGSLACLLFTFCVFQGGLPQTDARYELADNPFFNREAMEWIARTRKLEWGWAVLILGVASVIASASMEDDA